MGQRDPSASLLNDPFHLTVLGGLALRGSDGSLESRIGKRRLLLLATLAASGERGVSRDLLSALFWPESDDTHARGALKQAIYALRNELGSDALPGTSTGYALSAARIGSDLNDFRRALEGGELDRAVAAYTGPFLAGAHLDGAGELERLHDKVRSELEADYRNALLTLLGGETGESEKRAEWAQRLLELDPGDARAAALLVGALVRAGRLGQARRAADEYERWVRQELGGVPDASVAAALEAQPDSGPLGSLSIASATAPPDGPPRDLTARQSLAPDSGTFEPTRRAGGSATRRRIPTPLLIAGVGVLAIAAPLLILRWTGDTGPDAEPHTRVMDLRHVAKHPVYLRVSSLGTDSVLAAAALVLREALATAIPRVPAFVGVFRAPEDSVRLDMLPGRDTMAATFDVTTRLSFVADSVMVFLRAENRANPAIAATATLPMGTRSDPLARLDDTVERLLGALALRTDTDSLKTLAHERPPRFDSYTRWKAGFEVFHNSYDANRMVPLFLSSYSLDSTWLAPVYYAVRVFDSMEEFAETDSLLASARHRLAALPELRSEIETLARSRAQSRAAIGPASLPPAEVLLERDPTATGAQFYEIARQYYTASRPREAAILLAHIDSTGGILSDTDGSSYWLRGLSLHSAGLYPREMELVQARFDRSVTGISHVEYFDYMRAMAATGRSSEVLARFDDLPSDVVERDQYVYLTSWLAGELTFHGDAVVARSLFDRARQVCELRASTLVYYRHWCPLAHVAYGDTLAARIWMERLEDEHVDPLTLLGVRGMIAAAAGRAVEARAALERIAAYRDNLRQGRPDLWRARILARLGDREAALAALADAKENGWFPFWGMHGYFHFYPELAALKDDPRVRPYWVVDGPTH